MRAISFAFAAVAAVILLTGCNNTPNYRQQMPAWTDSRNIDHWAVGFVPSVQNNGIMRGFPDNTVRPDDFVTRQQELTIAGRTLAWVTSLLNEVWTSLGWLWLIALLALILAVPALILALLNWRRGTGQAANGNGYGGGGHYCPTTAPTCPAPAPAPPSCHHTAYAAKWCHSGNGDMPDDRVHNGAREKLADLGKRVGQLEAWRSDAGASMEKVNGLAAAVSNHGAVLAKHQERLDSHGRRLDGVDRWMESASADMKKAAEGLAAARQRLAEATRSNQAVLGRLVDR